MIDQTNNILAITETPTNSGSTYIVPNGKKLVITNFYTESQIDIFDINGNSTQVKIGYGHVLSLGIPLILEGGQILEGSSGSSFNGYLVDENYFAGCGGGGSSSSTSSLDSTTIANMIASAVGSGCSWRFPDGLTGTPITWHLPGNDYTVPAGKNLYITAFMGASQGKFMKIDGNEIMTNSDNEGFFRKIIVVGSGSVVSTASTTSSHYANFNGYLADETYFDGCGGSGGSSSSSTSSAQFNNQISNYNNILDESINSGDINYLHASWPTDVSFNYTVPAGKIMKITSYQHTNSSSSNTTYINGQQWSSNGDLPTLFSEGTQIEVQFDWTGDAVSVQYILFDN